MANELYKNNAATTTTEALDDTETAVDVTDATALPTGQGQYRIKIDDEIMLVTSVSSNTLTVERGAEGSTAASHSSGADVLHILTAGAVNAILNGSSNLVSAPTSQCFAGSSNEVTSSEYNADVAIVGGNSNTIDGASSSVICGGGSNDMTYNSTYLATGCFIGGGASNTIQASTSANVSYSAIIGGDTNTINGDRNAVLGGASNNVQHTAKDCVVMGKYAEAGNGATAARSALVHGHDFSQVVGEAQFERQFSAVTAVSSSGYHAYTNLTDSTDITLPPNYWATGTVKAIGVGTDGSSYHRIIHFAAANLGFGASILSQTTTEFSFDYGGSGPDCTLTSNADTIHANCSGTDTFNVKWLVCWEFVRLYQTVSGSTS